MYKYLFFPLLLSCTLFVTLANGQSLFYGVSEGGQVTAPTNANVYIDNTVLTIKTTQKHPGGSYYQDNFLSSYGTFYANNSFTISGAIYYWTPPSPTNPLNISIPPGGYVYVPGAKSDSLRAIVYFTASNGKRIAYYGPSVSVSLTAGAMVPIPSCSMTYTAPPPFPIDSVSGSYPNPDSIGAVVSVSLVN